MSAAVDGKRVLVGNLKLMKEEHIAVSTEHNEGTVVYVSEDGKYAGCIVISDVVKPNTKLALSELKKHGVKKTVMLTGDSKTAADRVAAEIGIDEVHSELLPADKVSEVEKLLDKRSPKKAGVCRRRNKRRSRALKSRHRHSDGRARLGRGNRGGRYSAYGRRSG